MRIFGEVEWRASVVVQHSLASLYVNARNLHM